MDRELRVFVRGEHQVDAARFEVPTSFFEMTAGDVRASMASAAQKNMLMTKTMREAAKPKYKVCAGGLNGSEKVSLPVELSWLVDEAGAPMAIAMRQAVSA